MFIYNLFTHPVYFLRFVAILAFSISLHELAHGYAALSQGDDTPLQRGHITLNPLVHMGWESLTCLCVTGLAWGQMPVNSAKFRAGGWSNIWVSVAGPLCNLGLALLFIVALRLMTTFNLQGIWSVEFFYLAAQVNLVLFSLNLVPLPPLDGFHVVSEAFPALKILEETPLSLFPLVVLLMNPDYMTACSDAAKLTVEVLGGVKLLP
ncbi:MAG: site-2 protease family protein [Timaviella obliquedivisa GSE-PSE-MK23-08B]|jgi:Zn-dependent protease|nr:site-2 protease family protein [Timaviella obliquedivisa GSE-PSE-MK23-08B]